MRTKKRSITGRSDPNTWRVNFEGEKEPAMHDMPRHVLRSIYLKGQMSIGVY